MIIILIQQIKFVSYALLYQTALNAIMEQFVQNAMLDFLKMVTHVLHAALIVCLVKEQTQIVHNVAKDGIWICLHLTHVLDVVQDV
jgi:hypothetical protein